MPVKYDQDDVTRGLRTSLAAVLIAFLNGDRVNSDFLKGVFWLAKSQAALYDIPWLDLVQDLCKTPGLGCLSKELQCPSQPFVGDASAQAQSCVLR